MLNNTQKIPEFLLKLRKLVDSQSTNKLIYWNEDGKSFTITDGHQLAKEYFPLLFKHKNIFSFIRQLNMYGFHKINRAELGVQIAKSCYDDSEWYHPSFIRGKPELLFKIQRKMTHNYDNNGIVIDGKNETGNYEISALKSAFRHLKQRDEIKATKIATLESQNKTIRDELNYFRLQMDSQSRWITELTSSFSSNPEALQNIICYNHPPKRNILALTASTFKDRQSPDNKSPGTSDETETQNDLPRLKTEKLEQTASFVFPTYYRSSTATTGDTDQLSAINDDIYNPYYFDSDTVSSRTTRDYEVDELLNDS